MSKVRTYEPLQKISIEANGDIPVHRFVGYDGLVCGAGEKSVGVTEFEWKDGDIASIVRAGTALVELGANVTVLGSALKSDDLGKAAPAAALSVIVPAGSTTVLSDATQPSLDIAGGVTPELINAYAMETGSAGDVIKVNLV